MPAQVWAIQQDDFQLIGCTGIGMHRNNGDCLPVLITPDMFQKFGFKKVVNENIHHWLDKVSVARYDEGWVLVHEDCHEGSLSVIGSEFFFVHQLQNLCYCINGHELEIKL